jgi:hypothetical protein
MQTNATDFLRQYSTQKLEGELRTLRRLAEEKRKLRDRAVKEYAEAANKVLMCEQILALKETSVRRASLPVDIIDAQRDQTSAVLDVVRGTGSLGIRPKEIGKTLESRGISVKPAYLHTILMRLKKRRAVRSTQGSYVAVE